MGFGDNVGTLFENFGDNMFKRTLLASAIALLAYPLSAKEVSPEAFLTTYADLAQLSYQHSLEDAKKIQAAIHQFVDNPTEQTFEAAKQAWLDGRDSYSRSEVFRLSEGPIDAEEGWVAEAYGALESHINSWPLDENMIDYTIDADGNKTSGNIIDSKGEFIPAALEDEPTAVNIDNINTDTISALNLNGGEANVASGYHAIEFLLWGQDQDYDNMLEDKITHGAMVAGQRPLSDFTEDAYASRRKDYLRAAVDKLVEDLATVNGAWASAINGNEGLYRAALLGQLEGAQAEKNIAQDEALKQILAGMGVFLKSELANERIAVAVLTPSEEDEHSCFSDNTHRDIISNFEGFKNVLFGRYEGQSIGVAPFDVLSDAEQAEVLALIKDIDARVDKMNQLATTSMHFDYQIHPSNQESAQNIVTMKNQMRKLADKMVLVAKGFGVSLTEEDVTDPEETSV